MDVDPRQYDNIVSNVSPTSFYYLVYLLLFDYFLTTSPRVASFVIVGSDFSALIYNLMPN